MAGENSQQQPRSGAGVAHVQHVLRLCEAAWFGDAPPVRLVVAPTHLSLSLPGRAAAAEDEHDDADSSSSVWETEESDDG